MVFDICIHKIAQQAEVVLDPESPREMTSFGVDRVKKEFRAVKLQVAKLGLPIFARPNPNPNRVTLTRLHMKSEGDSMLH